MTALLNVYSCLLTYPDAELLAALPELEQALQQADALAGVQPLLALLQANDLISLQENYVATFDRNPSHSLHLFEHVHGESRDRGQAMVDLIELYQKQGLVLEGSQELPDYLPLFLEFLSVYDTEAEALALLNEPLHVLQALGARLRQHDSAYGLVFTAIEELVGVRPLIATQAPEEVDIDQEWQEAEVRFLDAGAPSASCRPQTATAMRGE